MSEERRATRQQRIDYVAAIAFIVLCAVGATVGVVHLWSWPSRPSQIVRTNASTKLAPHTPIPLPKAPIEVLGAISRGSKEAKVVLIEYSDFKCPFCANFARETWPLLQREYVDSGKVRVFFRNLPIEKLHPFARTAAQTAMCADGQGKFWELHELMFARQGQLDSDELQRVVQMAGLDLKRLSRCLNVEAAKRVEADETSGRLLGVTGTPTFFVGLTQSDGGVLLKERLSGAQSASLFRAALDRWLTGNAEARP